MRLDSKNRNGEEKAYSYKGIEKHNVNESTMCATTCIVAKPPQSHKNTKVTHEAFGDNWPQLAPYRLKLLGV